MGFSFLNHFNVYNFNLNEGTNISIDKIWRALNLQNVPLAKFCSIENCWELLELYIIHCVFRNLQFAVLWTWFWKLLWQTLSSACLGCWLTDSNCLRRDANFSLFHLLQPLPEIQGVPDARWDVVEKELWAECLQDDLDYDGPCHCGCIQTGSQSDIKLIWKSFWFQ